MKNNEAVRIAIAETSVIIRGGLTAALKRLPNVKVQPIELLSVEALNDCLRTQYPEMLIVNPAFGDYFDVNRFPGRNCWQENTFDCLGYFFRRCRFAE